MKVAREELEYQKKRDNFGDLGVDGRTILK
jgi:hypothetical protein